MTSRYRVAKTRHTISKTLSALKRYRFSSALYEIGLRMCPTHTMRELASGSALRWRTSSALSSTTRIKTLLYDSSIFCDLKVSYPLTGDCDACCALTSGNQLTPPSPPLATSLIYFCSTACCTSHSSNLLCVIFPTRQKFTIPLALSPSTTFGRLSKPATSFTFFAESNNPPNRNSSTVSPLPPVVLIVALLFLNTPGSCRLCSYASRS